LTNYFRGIYGNPPHPKREVICRVLSELSLSNDELLFVGDSMADYEAASAEEVPFWGRVSENHFKEPSARWFKDLEQVNAELLRIQNEE
jgi:phosphoglycolate phosphatase-like HAD superfamily hydrolase